MLPTEFADLEPFAATWCLADEPARWQQRLDSTMADLQAFYDVAFPRMEDAIEFCDKFALDDMPEDVTNLLHLLFSLALVSYPVEVWQQQLPVNTGSAVIDRLADPRP